MTRQTSTNKYEQYGDRNKNRVIIKESSRGDGTEGALCTGEFRKGPIEKPLFVPPALAQDANQFWFLWINGGVSPLMRGLSSHRGAVTPLEAGNKYLPSPCDQNKKFQTWFRTLLVVNFKANGQG